MKIARVQSRDSWSSVVKQPVLSESRHAVDEGIVPVQEAAGNAEVQRVVVEIVVEEPAHTQSKGCRHSSASADLGGIGPARIEAGRTQLVIHLGCELVDLHR